MRAIKFRGHKFFGGALVYGQQIRETDDGFAIWNDEDEWIHTTDLEQLIAVDKNGHEVFEGDTVIRIAGDEDFDEEKSFPFAATFEDYRALLDGELILAEVNT